MLTTNDRTFSLVLISCHSVKSRVISEKPKYDEELTKSFERMTRGDLSNIPEPQKSMVRIFLSSTFSGKQVVSHVWYQNVMSIVVKTGIYISRGKSEVVLQWNPLKPDPLGTGHTVWYKGDSDLEGLFIQRINRFWTPGHVRYRGDPGIKRVWFREISLYLLLYSKALETLIIFTPPYKYLGGKINLGYLLWFNINIQWNSGWDSIT